MFAYVCAYDTMMYLTYFKMLEHETFLITKQRSNCAAETAKILLYNKFEHI